jgi:hypothetical protein
MANNNFARGPQNGFSGDNNDRGRQFSAYMSSVYENAIASTRSVDVVTQTTTLDDSLSTTDPDDIDSDQGTLTNALFFPTASSTNAGTTLVTQTSSQENSNLQSSSPSSEQSQVQNTSQSDDDGGGLSGGELAAAIAVPIIVVTLSALAAFLLFRRRRKSRQEQPNTPEVSSTHSRGGAAGFFGWREKWGSLRSSASSHKDPTPEVTSVNNQPAFVPARTISHEEQPPPYPVENAPRPTTEPQTRQLHLATDVPRAAPESTSPVSPLSPSEFLSPNPSFMRTARRGSTAASINSDAYSETASIHSARAARMSVGGPTMIAPLRNGSPNSTRHDRGPGSVGSSGTGDPFGDARRANTPSLEGLRIAISAAGSPKKEDQG